MVASFTVADNYIMQDGEAIAEGAVFMDGMDGSACHWLPRPVGDGGQTRRPPEEHGPSI